MKGECKKHKRRKKAVRQLVSNLRHPELGNSSKISK